MVEELKLEAREVIVELLENEHVADNSLIVIGCSTSEIVGENIGKGSSPEAAESIVNSILDELKNHNCEIAAQCCEHLNRALVMERDTALKYGFEIVCVRPRPKAGGSFATAVYEALNDPVVVEHVTATAGLDIGNTMIGMHMKHVAVPLRLKHNRIGQAHVTAAFSRPKLIGGNRADYP